MSVKFAAKYFDADFVYHNNHYDDFNDFIEGASKIDEEFRCYDDVMDFVIAVRDKKHRTSIIDFRYPEGADSPELKTLLSVPW